ncbi:MAG: FFLEELY motif protein [Bacillota bacterium]
MKKQEAMAVIRRELEAVAAERRSARGEPAAYAARIALRQFQSQRMACTHADLLRDPESHAAARFFLDDLYGTEDLTQRDADLERVVPAMERLLPVSALKTVAEAIALDALSEKLDAAMARRLGQNFSEEDYIAAYRKSSTRAERERQIVHVESVGMALCELVRVPLVGSTLSMMRGPARLAGLAELQSFLERGFKAFKAMKKPHLFVATIVQRERAILDRLYAGVDNPFALDEVTN